MGGNNCSRCRAADDRSQEASGTSEIQQSTDDGRLKDTGAEDTDTADGKKEGPPPSTLEVSGESAAFDGVYTIQQDFNGRPTWVRQSESQMVLYWTKKKARWIIAQLDDFLDGKEDANLMCSRDDTKDLLPHEVLWGRINNDLKFVELHELSIKVVEESDEVILVEATNAKATSQGNKDGSPGVAVPELLLPESDDEKSDGLKPGAKVRIIGIKSQVTLNGQLGILQSFDAAAQRWTVWLEAESRQIAAKLDNLWVFEEGKDPGPFAAGQPVEIHGMQKAMHLNGQSGFLVSFDSEKGRWIVTLKSKDCDGWTQVAVQSKNLQKYIMPEAPPLSGKDLKGKDLNAKDLNGKAATKETGDAGTFKAGDWVEIVDMTAAKHLNGEVGRLQTFDESTGRWTLMLVADRNGEVGKLLAARAKNLKHTASPQAKEEAKNEKRKEAYEKIGKTADDIGCKQQ